MRPTIFAELAAAELRSGTECCQGCDYVFYEAVSHCPRCGLEHAFHISVAEAQASWFGVEVSELSELTFRDLSEFCGSSATQ